MGQREKVVQVAQTYVGAKQGSSQHKKLVDTFNKYARCNTYEVANYSCAWCAIAASSWANIAGVSNSIMPRTYNCGTMITEAKKRGIWVENDNYKPKAGDFVIFYWSAPSGDCTYGASHIGLVEKVSGNTITTIEGNMGSPSHVGRRSFPVGYRYIRGFIVPRYQGSGTGYTGEFPTGVVRYGSTGENVRRVQKFLNWYFGNSYLTVDGDCGVKTVSQIRSFQRCYKSLEADGVVGSKTIAVMKEVKK